VRKIVLLRLDAPVYGIAAAYVARYFPAQFLRARITKAACGIGLISLAVLWCGQFNATESVGFRALIFSLVPAGFALMLPYFASWTRSDSALLTALFATLSRWTYSIYLIHVLALLLILKFYGDWIGQSAAHMASASLIWLAITVALSAFLYRYFEQPLTHTATPKSAHRGV
jgi:peptidoglycan/LPS O-acetylase OafA/YrhL